MATTQDLMGLGMAPALAEKEGHSLTSGTAGGANQAAAVTIPTSVTTIAPAAGLANYILRPAASLAKPYVVANPTAVPATLYPPVGGTINGGAANASITVAANSFTLLIATGSLTWFAK